jgi:site-specific DNA-cytosine methylase
VKDVLVINTYAGSLLLAARKINMNVVGSFEDAGYGMKTQKLNFDDVRFVEKRKDWPALDLRGTMVLAHPPCAAFSAQNTNASRRGTKTDAFACTKDVLKYSMSAGADAVLVESVTPAMEGARSVHDRTAEKWGYSVFRVLQNSVTFGLPQWRPRFWAIFVRDRLISRSFRMKFSLEPRWKSVGELMSETDDPSNVLPAHKRRFDRAVDDMRSHGLSPKIVKEILAGEHDFGSIPRIVSKIMGETREYICKHWFRNAFEASNPFVLNPESFANTLMYDHNYYSQGRLFTADEYRAYMGYPRDYKFHASQMEFLSRGVCPPVAAWVARSVANSLSLVGRPKKRSMMREIAAGEVADLTLKRGEVPKR